MEVMMKLPRIMLAGVASGSGKTLLTCGILRALQRRGRTPCSFKCGPDYIDPLFHESVLHTSTYNVDTFFTDENTTLYLFSKAASHGDISILEGVMGYYDGLGGTSTKASSYDIACTCDTPVILLVDTKGMSLSVAAIIKGFMSYREDHHIQGVILNRMSSALYPEIKAEIEKTCHVQVFGYLPVMKDIHIHSRHLGLLMPDEINALQDMITLVAKQLEKTVNINALWELAQQTKELSYYEPKIEKIKTPVRIAMAKDEAFCFYYQENIDLLCAMGAEVVLFSPMHDTALPNDIQGLYLPGGYPELYADTLAENHLMKASIRSAIANKLPYIAECGGFLYLHKSLEGSDGVFYDMVGVIAGEARNVHSLTRFGYIGLEVQHEGLFHSKDGICRAHEFHYYDSDHNGAGMYAQKPNRKRGWDCAHIEDVSYAGFPHLYFYANVRYAYRFLKVCEKYRDYHL